MYPLFKTTAYTPGSEHVNTSNRVYLLSKTTDFTPMPPDILSYTRAYLPPNTTGFTPHIPSFHRLVGGFALQNKGFHTNTHYEHSTITVYLPFKTRDFTPHILVNNWFYLLCVQNFQKKECCLVYISHCEVSFLNSIFPRYCSITAFCTLV